MFINICVIESYGSKNISLVINMIARGTVGEGENMLKGATIPIVK